MRVMFEAWLVAYKVDIVFSGHVHAYERSVIHFLLLLIPDCIASRPPLPSLKSEICFHIHHHLLLQGLNLNQLVS